MKKLSYWVFWIVCCHLLFVSCGNGGNYDWIYVDFRLKTNVSETINIYFTTYDFNDSRHDVSMYNLYPMAEYLCYNCPFVERQRDVFSSAVVKALRKKRLVITTLAGDTLANWDNNSAVFNDKKHWTIGSKNVDEFYCTLNLTDEVLQLK